MNRRTLAAGTLAVLITSVTPAASRSSELVSEPKYRGPTVSLRLHAALAGSMAPPPQMEYVVFRHVGNGFIFARVIRAASATPRLHPGVYKVRAHPVGEADRECRPAVVRVKPKSGGALTIQCPAPARPSLTVSVLASGGPGGAVPHEVSNGHIELTQAGQVIATSSAGNLTIRLNPGLYTVAATLDGGRCQAQTVTLSHHDEAIELGCSIP